MNRLYRRLCQFRLWVLDRSIEGQEGYIKSLESSVDWTEKNEGENGALSRDLQYSEGGLELLKSKKGELSARLVN